MNPPRCVVCGVVGGMAMNACGHGEQDAVPEDAMHSGDGQAVRDA